MSHSTTYGPPTRLWVALSPECGIRHLKGSRGIPNMKLERGELERDWSLPMYFYSRTEARQYAHERNARGCTERGRVINRKLAHRWIVRPVAVTYSLVAK
jgi:hypothetical protein